MHNLHISENSVLFEQADIDALDASAPAFCLDSTCLSPPESQKYPHTITSPVSNPNDTSLTIVSTPLSLVSDTHKLISSQWAMEALRMRREAQSSVDKQLQSLKEKRKDKEQLARARARRSIGKLELYVLFFFLFVLVVHKIIQGIWYYYYSSLLIVLC